MLEEKRIPMIIILALPFIAYAPSYFSVLHKYVLIFCASWNKGNRGNAKGVKEGVYNADGWALALSLVSGWVCDGKMVFNGWDVSISLPDRASSKVVGFSPITTKKLNWYQSHFCFEQ